MALIGLKVTSVTPMVKVSGAGGKGGASIGGGGGGSVPSCAVATGFGGAGFAAGAGVGTTTTKYLLNSKSFFRNSVLPGETFFSTMAHFTPFRSSNS